MSAREWRFDEFGRAFGGGNNTNMQAKISSKTISLAAAASAYLLVMTSNICAQEAARGRNTGAPAGEMVRLAALRGQWTAEFESRAGPNEPFAKHRTTSSITPLLGGAFLQERVSMPTVGGRPIELIGIWGYDRFRSLYRFAWLDDAYALFDVHEGNWEGEALVVSNTRARTTLVIGGREIFSRMIWSEIGVSTFTVESLASTDGGQTWFTQAKGRYTRQK